jgi:hypothetical protein
LLVQVPVPAAKRRLSEDLAVIAMVYIALPTWLVRSIVIRGSVAQAGLEVGFWVNLMYALLVFTLTCTKFTVDVTLPALQARPGVAITEANTMDL